LTDAEIAEIRQLASICDAHDHATIRVNWEMLANRPKDAVNDILYYQNGALVGCLSLYSFSRREAEASGMVYPEFRRKGIFRALMMTARCEMLLSPGTVISSSIRGARLTRNSIRFC